MRKQTLAILVILTVVLYALSMITSSAASADTTIGSLFSVPAAIIGLVAWIGGLVKQARQRQWGWFIGTIFFGILCLAIYLMIVPETAYYPTQRRYDSIPTYQPPQYYEPQPSQERQYYQPQQHQEPEPYQEQPNQELIQYVQPGSYQEAMHPDFYQEKQQGKSGESQE